MDGLVVNVTSGCVQGAAGATIHVRNAAPEMTTNNLSPLIYIMAAFASSAGHSSAASPEKVLTAYLVKGKPYDTYQIPAGTRLFKSYRDTLAKWSPEKVFPVFGPAYFGFDEPNVSENYGFAFAYKTTQPYELLAIDSQNTLAYLWGLAEGNKDVQRTLTVCFGYDPEKPQIRYSDEKWDYVLVDFLCNHGFEGYAGDYIATDSGGQFHPECVICGDPIHVKLNTEYNVDGKSGLASPIVKHVAIQSMLTERRLKKQTTDKSNVTYEKRNLESAEITDRFGYSENEDSENENSENENPNQKKIKTDNTTDNNDNLSSVGRNLFGDLGGGAKRKKRTQKRTQIRRQKRTCRHKQKKNKSRK